MDNKHKQELIDQYDDAVFALMMDEYAEEEGARLLQEFEEAMASGTLPEIPTSLDQKCHQIIRHEFTKQKRKRQAKQVLRMARKVAVISLVVLGVSLTTVLSVDALRVPFLNYILEYNNEYIAINFSENDPIPESYANRLADVLPESYKEVQRQELGNGVVVSVYQDDNGNVVKYTANHADGEYRMDSQHSDYKEIRLKFWDAFIINKDGILLTWFDAEYQMVYSIYANNYTEDDLVKIAEQLIA